MYGWKQAKELESDLEWWKDNPPKNEGHGLDIRAAERAVEAVKWIRRKALGWEVAYDKAMKASDPTREMNKSMAEMAQLKKKLQKRSKNKSPN
ncbi:hypothetical protein ACEPAI_1567 [Sanghuangporus weigelae]